LYQLLSNKLITPGLISLFIGKKGTGKTTVIVNLLKSKKSPYYNKYDRIYLFSPTAQKDSKLDFLVDEVSSFGNFYNELTNENLQEVLDKITPNFIAQKGISRTFQNLALFKRMSVLDNILVGRKLHSKANFLEVAFQLPRAIREENQNKEKCEEIIKFLEIENIKNTPVGKLPYGLQKKVELGRALATEANILLLDEPMAGMNVEEKRDMCRFILKVNDELGTTIVLIEHDMGVVMDISDRVVVLDYGKIIGDDVPDNVRSNKKVIDAYLGVAHD
jgi:branched-chain amino acid transport system ATP-binding protein